MISLDKFKSDIFHRSTTKSSRFLVEIYPPVKISSYDTEKLTFRCDSAELPGRTLSLQEQRTYGVGRKQPQASVFADMNITLICSADFTEKKFFDHWQNMVQDLEDYKFGYYDDYIGTIHVTQLNDELQPIYKIELKEAFPTLVAPMPLNWDTSNDLQRAQITISYRQWEELESTLDAPSISGTIQNRLDETLDKLKLSKFKL
jgi:hypothetical protein